MKKKIKYFLFILPGCLLLFLTGCPGMNPADDKPGDDKIPQIVSGLVSTPLKYDDRIHLDWQPVDDFDSYKIYRYTSKSETAPFVIFTSDMEFFDDLGSNAQGAEVNKVYYYKVSSVRDGHESALNANFVPGLYSSSVDYFEPNDELSDAWELFPREEAYHALIYSFDGAKYTTQDRDYYSLPVDSGRYTLTIDFDDTSSLDGELQIVTFFGTGSRTETLTTSENPGMPVYKLDINTNDDNVVTTFRIEFRLPEFDLGTVAGYSIKLVQDD